MLPNYLRTAFRNMMKATLFSFINLAGLAMGLACTIFILLWVADELSYDGFHAHEDQLYRVAFTYRPMSLNQYYQPGALSGYLKSEYPEITRATFMQNMETKLTFDHRGFFEKGIRVEPDFLDMFSFPLIEGDIQSFNTHPNSVVITQSLAEKIFGEQDAIGHSITVNNNTSLLVTGVLADVPHNTQFNFDYLVRFRQEDAQLKEWGAKSGVVYVQLHPEADYQEVSNKIAGIIDGINPEWKNTLFLQPLAKDHLHPVTGQGPIIYVYVFSSIALIILLIACINFMNISTARAEKRLKEIGVRKVVGSTRFQLVGQFLTESLINSIIATGLAVLLVELLLPFINTALRLQLQFHLTPGVSGSLIIMVVFTGILAGSYPAFYLSSLQPKKVLYNVRHKAGKHAVISKGLVTVQFALSVLFIIGVLIINRQMNYVRTKDLGFNKEHIIMLATRGELRDKAQLVKRQLLLNDEVTDVTVSSNDMVSWTNSGPMQWEGMPAESNVEFGYNWVDDDFMNTLQLAVTNGRFFSQEYSTDNEEAFVVNEAAVKAMGITHPVGKEVSAWFGRKGKIIGVVRDYQNGSLHNGVMPSVLIPAQQGNYLFIRISPDDIPAAIRSIKATVQDVVPDDPFEYSFLDEKISSMYTLDHRTQMLVLFAAGLAIILSCLGLFGLAFYNVERRVKEIGVRKVLGASTPEIVFMVGKDFTRWILLAIVIAWMGAWFIMNRWLENFTYRIGMNLMPFVAASVLAFTIAYLTIGWQAVRVAKTNPIDSLRYE